MMGRTLKALLVFGMLRLAAPACAQVDLQKFKIDKVSMRFVTNKPSSNRCLLWFPFESDKNLVTEFDDDGNPFARVKLRARLRGKDCYVNFRPQEAMKIVKQDEDDIYFEAIVHAPVTIIEFSGNYNGPDFHDQLIFQTNATPFGDIGFFSFFKKARVYFETRYTKVDTNYNALSAPPRPISPVVLLPVFGGRISIPTPWFPHLSLEFSMFQNLGSLVKNPDVVLQYSEYAFGANYSWEGKETWGHPSVAGVLDYRGRNIYQSAVLYKNPAAGGPSKPLIIGAITMPGVGFDASWFPGGIYYPWENKWSRFGLDLSYRYYFGGQIPLGADEGGSEPLHSHIIEAGLEYRLTRRWAIAAGYSAASESFSTAQGLNIAENLTNYFLRLQLVPYLPEPLKK